MMIGVGNLFLMALAHQVGWGMSIKSVMSIINKVCHMSHLGVTYFGTEIG